MGRRTRVSPNTFGNKYRSGAGISGNSSSLGIYPFTSGTHPITNFPPFSDVAHKRSDGRLLTISPSLVGGTSITDEPKGRGKRNYCLHTVTEYRQGVHYYTAKHATKDSWYVLSDGMPAPPSLSGFTAATLTEAQLNQLRAESWATLSPSVDSGFSAANFLYELKDYRELVKYCGRVISGFESVIGLLTRKFSGYDLLTGKSAAELNLEYQFNFKPLIRDLATVIDLIQHLPDAASKFNEQGNKRNIRHFSKDVSKVTSVTGPGIYRTYSQTQVRYCAQLVCRYSIDVDDTFGFFARYAGLDITLSTLWNAFPFSFLVDMFTTFGKSLAYISRSPVANLDIEGWSESQTCEIIRVLCLSRLGDTNAPYSGGDTRPIQYFTGGTGLPGDIDVQADFPVAWSKYRRYERTPGLTGQLYGAGTWVTPTYYLGDELAALGERAVTLASLMRAFR